MSNDADNAGKTWYRHKTINRFSVGRFNFANHILEVKAEDKDEFLREYDGLQGVDQVNIVEIPNIVAEKPVDTSRVVRGPDSAGKNGLSAQDRAVSLAAREEEIANRERLIEERERELGLTVHQQLNGEQAFQENGGIPTTDPDADSVQANLTGGDVIGKVSDSIEDGRTDADAPATTETEPKPGLRLGGGLKLNG